MKPFYVKSEDINHEKQQELLDLAVDAGATLFEHRPCTRHEKDKGRELNEAWDYFGVDDQNNTWFSVNVPFEFGTDAVEMTYDQAWEYVTGIIRAKESPMSRGEAIEWLRENTTDEDWIKGDLIVEGWSVERFAYQPYRRLTCGDEYICINDVFPPAPVTPRTPLFDRVKQALGLREVEIAGEDHLVGQVKGDAHKARILDKIIKEFKIYPGQDIINILKARIEVAKESPAPRSASPKNIEKVFFAGYSGVNATPVMQSVGPPVPIVDRSKPRNKYDHEIIPGVHVDVYDVLNAFPTGGADVDHAIKKLLQPGDRGHKDEITDCEEAIKSIQRRIDHIKEWGL